MGGSLSGSQHREAAMNANERGAFIALLPFCYPIRWDGLPQRERDMKATIATLLAAAAGIIFAQLPATAQNRASSEGETSQRQQLLAPNIAHVAVRATLLHWGMSCSRVPRAARWCFMQSLTQEKILMR